MNVLKFGSSIFAVLSLLISSLTSFAADVTGRVVDSSSSNSVASARVTLFTPNLQFFREKRTDLNGDFQFSNIDAGTYQLGVAARGYEYQERTVAVSITPVSENFSLSVETNGGRWTIIGNTAPELLDGTGSGTLLATGEMLMCHDTMDPIGFDPVSQMKWFPPSSGSPQGCHIPTLLSDGRLFVAGGSAGGNPQDPVVKTVQVYRRSTNSWSQLAPLNIGRWYPGIVRFPDERLMILGGELNDPGFGRTNTCEIYNLATNSWTSTGSFNLPTEIPPAIVLNTGEILKTWRFPELYNITSGNWRAAPAMLQPRNGAAGGGHCDHEIVPLPDGRVMAVGVDAINTNANTRFCEFYNPSSNTWSLGPNPQHLRTQPEALILPDARVLAFGGTYTGLNPGSLTLRNAGQVPNCTNVADLYDPAINQWRGVAPLNRYIHYHNVTVLVPDGRVVATGGAGGGNLFGDDNSIEAFEPPYLFRGIRPRIDSLSTTNLVLGSSFTARVSLTDAVTNLVLVSARAATHWVDGGPQRYLTVNVTQNGSDLMGAIPNDPVRFLPGWYILFAMVDDIPSVGRMVRIVPNVPPVPTSAVSRKTHGTAGTFDIDLPLTSNSGIECRSGGANKDYQVVLKFPNAVTFSSAMATPGQGGTGSVSNTSNSADGTQVTVNLTNVSNAQRITVNLFGATDGTTTGDVTVRIGILVGDDTGNGAVNSSDISQTKSQSGQALTSLNFRDDINANSLINSSDIGLVKLNAGTALP